MPSKKKPEPLDPVVKELRDSLGFQIAVKRADHFLVRAHEMLPLLRALDRLAEKTK